MTKNKAKKILSTAKKKDYIAAYLFIAPVVLGLLVFYIFPFLQNFWFSFNDVNKFNVTKFIGLKNYQKLIADKELWRTFFNTLKYVLITVPVSISLSTILAALLNTDIKGKSFYRTIFFLPSVTMPVAISLVWKWIYNGDYGLLNNFLKIFGMGTKSWLSDSDTALFAIIIVGIWCVVGYNMIILLAGMQGISRSYYEAADVDGASPVVKFFKITIPLLSPTIFFVIITSTIGAFQVFDTVYIMITKNSTSYESTQTLVMMFYRYAFDYGKKGYAAAISIFIFVIIMFITILQIIGQKKWVNYE